MDIMKCGEIFLTENSSFNYKCFKCEKHYDILMLFKSHIFSEHNEILNLDIINEESTINSDRHTITSENNQRMNENNLLKIESISNDSKMNDKLHIMKSEEQYFEVYVASENENSSMEFTDSLEIEKKYFDTAIDSEPNLKVISDSEGLQDSMETKSEIGKETNFEQVTFEIYNDFLAGSMHGENGSNIIQSGEEESECGNITENIVYPKNDEHTDIKCKRCNKQFENNMLFMEHEKKNRCGVCPFCNKNLEDIMAHMKKRHKKFHPDFAKVGDFVYSLGRGLIRKTLKEESYKFEELYEVEGHEFKLTGNALCACGFEFSEENEDEDFFQHLKNQLFLRCKNCGQHFANELNYFDHIKTHQNSEDDLDIDFLLENNKSEFILQCRYCHKQFDIVSNYKMHKIKNTCGKCRICKKTYENIWSHISFVHQTYNQDYENGTFIYDRMTGKFCYENPGKNIINCNKCGRVFQKKFALTKHICDTLYKCNLCERVFHKKNSFRVHLRTHSEEKPFTCPYCSQTFKQRMYLQQHIKRHITIPNIECTYKDCTKLFKTVADRKRHEVFIHQTEKKKLCVHCGETFKTTDKLHSHVNKKHLSYEQRKFKCSYCNEKFISRIRCISHENKHKGIRPFNCYICSKSFYDRANLSKHVRRQHNLSVKSLENITALEILEDEQDNIKL